MADDSLSIWRQWMQPDPERVTGSVLPWSAPRDGSGPGRPAIPTSVLETGRGLIDLLSGTRTGTVSPEATSALASLISPTAAARPNPSQVGIFVGPLAGRSFSGPAQRANDLRGAGHSRDEVFAQTGHFFGPDGRARVEVPDTAAQIRPATWDRSATSTTRDTSGTQTTLGMLLDHPDLYRAYPQLEQMPVRTHAGLPDVPGYPGVTGAYATRNGDPSRLDGAIFAAGETPDAMRGTLLHEIQHWIQVREGLTRGSNSDAPEVVRRADAEIARRVGQLQGHADRNRAAGRNEIADAIDREIGRVQSPAERESAAYQQYRAAGGEAESRAVERRSTMPADSLRSTPPRDSYDLPQEVLWDPATGRPLRGWP